MFDLGNPLLPAILALGGTVIGALGAIFGGIISHFLKVKSEYKIFRKNKLEELYSGIDKWINKGSLNFIFFNSVFKKETDWNGYLDLINAGKISEINFPNYEIIINLYFKELIPYFNKSIEVFRDVRRYIDNDIKSTYLSGSDILIHKSVYDEKINAMIKYSNILKDQIHSIARKI
jgi:hypothetical protein